MIQFKAIGHVENDIEIGAAPESVKSMESRIILDPDLVSGLKGLELGQRVMVVFYFHRSQNYDLLQHPRGDKTLALQGVFALRSPNRPNPIGITQVDLETIEGNVLRVRGLDAINGTPVLDLKPARRV